METELEWVLTNSYKVDMIAYLAVHPEYFGEAVKLAISDKQPYSCRAAWLLWSCIEQNDYRIKGSVKDIIEALPVKNENQQRELLKILQFMDLNEESEALLFNQCVSVWEKINNKPSVRLNAFKIIIKITKKYPALLNEIEFLTQDEYLNTFSFSARKSISRMLSGLVKVDR